MKFTSRTARALLLAIAFVPVTPGAPPVSTTPIEGLRDASPRTHALVGGRIFVSPGKVIERGTLVIRDGLIVAVGADVTPPPEARRWDVAGRTLYAGFIESQASAFLPAGWKPAAAGPRAEDTPAAPVAAAPGSGATTESGARAWNPRVTPERSAARALAPDAKAAEGLRTLGFTAANVAPTRGIFRGTSAVVSLEDKLDNRAVIRPDAAQHVAFERTADFTRGLYPTSLMGAVALVRQTFLDAQWYAAVHAAYAAGKAPAMERPETNASLAALAPALRREQPIFFALHDELDVERTLALRREFGLRLTLVGTGTEYRVTAALSGADVAVIVPLTFPETPVIETTGLALDVSLDELQHWDLAPANAALLVKAGVPVALTSFGLKRPRDFWPNVRKAVAAGLPAEAALAALTTVPARLLGASQFGTLEPGRAAHVVVSDGDLFTSEDAAVAMVWVDGRPHPFPAWERFDARGTWAATWDGTAGPATLVLSGKTPVRLTGKSGETKITAVARTDEVVLLAPVKLFGGAATDPGIVRLSARVRGATLAGTGELPDGREFRWTATRSGPAPAAPETTKTAIRPGTEKKAGGPTARTDVYPAGAYGRRGRPEQPGALVLKNVTVWTSGPAGTLERADLLIEKGRIKQVGANLRAPAGATVIDASGKHVTPGLIDCHSHVATNAINESGTAVSCETRIADVVDPTDINLYRQLASGVTTINILHGSANPIGGENHVIKVRWGLRADGLKFEGAKPGVKFALGENVTRANSPQLRGRYPASRMGVGEIIRDTFARAAEYDRQINEARARRSPIPVRRDLRLEAAARILRGDLLIHAHGYRQDEALMFVRLAQELKLPVAVFVHMLEGYKVAPEIAALGAGVTTFTDWWAFKHEAGDAIPWNAALMRDAGVLVSFNSDDEELARRLNTEAAKAVKYGGVPPAEALQFVTLNPARQLRVHDRIGSLEPGKDADFVVWSSSPLSSMSRVEQTWIDGRRYFSLEDDAAVRAADAAERTALIQKAIAARQKTLAAPGGPDSGEPAAESAPTPTILHGAAWLDGDDSRDVYRDGRTNNRGTGHTSNL